MTDQLTTLRAALSALESVRYLSKFPQIEAAVINPNIEAAITDLCALIASMEAQPEPFAYCYVQKKSSADILTFDDAPEDAVDGTLIPLYTAKQLEKLRISPPSPQ